MKTSHIIGIMSIIVAIIIGSIAYYQNSLESNVQSSSGNNNTQSMVEKSLIIEGDNYGPIIFSDEAEQESIPETESIPEPEQEPTSEQESKFPENAFPDQTIEKIQRTDLQWLDDSFRTPGLDH